MPGAELQHHGGSFDSQSVVVVACLALALYNALELILVIFITFKQWHGLYFWSLLVSSIGIIPYSVGYVIVFFQLTVKYAGFIIDSYGWVTMVTGQSVVLYSRLHLVLHDRRVLKAVLWMIIIDGVLFHVTTTVVLFGSNFGGQQKSFTAAYDVIEKVQMTGFCVQEFIISALYLSETVRLLKIMSTGGTRRTVWQLSIINVIIIVMDLFLLGLEYKNLRVHEQAFKCVFYSVKLKLEFAVLGKLVQIVRNGNQVLTGAVEDTSDFRNPSCAAADVTHAPTVGKKGSTAQPYWLKELGEISSEHVERTEDHVKSPNGSVIAQESSRGQGDALGYERQDSGIGRGRTTSDAMYAEFVREISQT